MEIEGEGEEARRLARELADLTGESVTTAVTEAIRERLDRLRRERGDGLAVDDEVIFRVDRGEVQVASLDQSVRRAQALVRRHVPKNVSLVDRLIRMRRAEVE